MDRWTDVLGDIVMLLKYCERPLIPKSHLLKSLLSIFNLTSKVLIVTDQISENLQLASRNLREVHVLSHRSLNVYEIMKNNKVVFTKKPLNHS